MIMTIMMHWQGNYEDNDDDDAGDENDASIIGNIGDTDDQIGFYGIWRMTDDNFAHTALFVCLQFYSELLEAKSQLHNKCLTTRNATFLANREKSRDRHSWNNWAQF